MNPEAAAAVLLSAERNGERLEALPVPLRPANLAEGHDIQDAFARQWGAPVAGWKIAATSAGGRAMLGVDGPLSGRLFTDRLFAPGDEVPLAATAMGVMEVELAFTFGQAIAPRDGGWTREAVVDAVDALHVAVELPQTRFRQVGMAGAPQITADNACGGSLLLGAPLSPRMWRDRDLAAVAGRIGAAGSEAARGAAANVLGHPLDALLWLVRAVTGRGLTINAGEVVSTGSVTPPPPVYRGAQVHAELDDLGQVRFTVV